MFYIHFISFHFLCFTNYIRYFTDYRDNVGTVSLFLSLLVLFYNCLFLFVLDLQLLYITM